jgi:hypothetical protein
LEAVVTPAELLDDPWAFGEWCFILDEVRLLPTPIPCRGMQGWWPLSAALRLDLYKATGEQVNSALTLQQPYASAISHGPKRIENRPQRRRISPGGVWLGLHAGKALYDRAGVLLMEWRSGPDPLWPDAPTLTDLPLGVLLGAMHVTECLRYPEASPLFRRHGLGEPEGGMPELEVDDG